MNPHDKVKIARSRIEHRDKRKRKAELERRLRKADKTRRKNHG